MVQSMMLKGKRALVCGASQGIGEATARELAKQGVQVHLFARSNEKLAKVCESLEGGGKSFHSFTAVDMGDLKSLERAVDEVLASGPIDILVHNSGGPKPGAFNSASTEEFETAFSQHVLSAQLITKKLAPAMAERKYGRIINVISTSVKTPIPNLLVSNTIRGAMANWAKTLATELGPHGITVNNVLPGFTKTPRFDSLLKSTCEKLKKTPEEVERMWLETIPARRFAEPIELAYVITFLASPMASYVNGINVPVDGGRTPSL